ncbi:MAG: hypothetical protein PHI12_11065 [Dehalococcoidales bacterium]|nr:hypothetical protein [Dehalococcoidales bacterium]
MMNKEGNFVCATCNKEFQTRDEYMDHRRYPCGSDVFIAPASSTPESKPGRWTCPICGRSMDDAGRDAHMKVHWARGEVILEDEAKEERDEMEEEMEEETEESIPQRLWTCPICALQMAPTAKGSHMRVHACRGEKVPEGASQPGAEWICPICGLGLNQKGVKRHLEMHEKEGDVVPEERRSLLRRESWICPVCFEGMTVQDKEAHLDAHREKGEIRKGIETAERLMKHITDLKDEQLDIREEVESLRETVEITKEEIPDVRGALTGTEAREAFVVDQSTIVSTPPLEIQEEKELPEKSWYRACENCKIIYSLDDEQHWHCVHCGGELTADWKAEELRSTTRVLGAHDR